MMVKIVAAALQVLEPNTGALVTISLPPPARHHTLIAPTYRFLGRAIRGDEQGFLTSEGQYVDRTIAFQIANGAKQLDLKNRKSGANGCILFSEDLW